MQLFTNSWHSKHHFSVHSHQPSSWIGLIYLGILAILSGCSNVPQKSDAISNEPKAEIHGIPPALQGEPKSRYGNPESYCVSGICYHTLVKADGYCERGIASWYGPNFHGHLTSNREVYDMYGMTAAHKTLPLPCYVKVANLRTGQSIIVRVNDRGPFHADRIIDLSYSAADKLGILRNGTGMVEVTAMDPAAHPLPPLLLTRTQELVSRKSQNGASPQLFVQIGAFGDRSNAERVAAKLSPTLSSAVRIKPLNAPTPLYRVQFGPIDSVAQADDLTARLHQLGLANTQVVVE